MYFDFDLLSMCWIIFFYNPLLLFVLENFSYYVGTLKTIFVFKYTIEFVIIICY